MRSAITRRRWKVCEQIREVVALGVQVGIVVAAATCFRGATGALSAWTARRPMPWVCSPR